MIKNNIKIYLFVFLFLIFFLILIILLPINKKKESKNNNNQPPTPTFIKILPTKSFANNPSPNNLLPPTFTGGGDQEPPKEEIELALASQELRKKLPLIEKNFMITYDYQEDKFVVSLIGNQNISKNDFESWRQKNYPNIQSKEFIFQTD